MVGVTFVGFDEPTNATPTLMAHNFDHQCHTNHVHQIATKHFNLGYISSLLNYTYCIFKKNMTIFCGPFEFKLTKVEFLVRKHQS